VHPGEKLALVGPSGAGKSTVFQLLMRFYDPSQGVVRIDGVDLTRADPAAVRGRIALVPQEPAIFASSVRFNVSYGAPMHPSSRSAKPARTHLPPNSSSGYPRATTPSWASAACGLSGGQRQRLAIARAILSDRPCCCSTRPPARSTRKASAWSSALERLMQGRTTLIIAHRLATVRSVDRIAVIDRGRLVSLGRHEELLAESELYSRLAALQFGL
jgi:ATP-binding cassette subfamily B protein